MKIVHVKNYEKRKKSLAKALASFAAYLGVPGVRLRVTSQGMMIKPLQKKVVSRETKS